MSELEPVITPGGELRLAAARGDAEGAGALPQVVAEGFAGGTGAGLLELGALPAGRALPAGLLWARELATRFLAAVRGGCDLDAPAGRLALPAPDDAALSALVDAAPPMRGAEYLSTQTLSGWWRAMGDALSAHEGALRGWLASRDPVWEDVGRVCLHLAENRRDAERPFAFLATYTSGVSAQGALQHRPLGEALARSIQDGERAALLRLLVPLKRAAASSEWMAALLSSKAIYRPRAWTPDEAWRFLRAIPELEASGLMVRIPDWWKRRGARPRVQGRLEADGGGGLEAQVLLDFSLDVVVGDGEPPLDEDEIAALLEGSQGLRLVRGAWVEVDPQALRQVLERFEAVAASAVDGVTFLEGMRMLAGASDALAGDAGEGAGEEDVEAWSEVVAGASLAGRLAALRDPERLAACPLDGTEFQGTLRPYQEVGLRWLELITGLGLGACLADDMGLGKTVTVLALLARRRARGVARPTLLVVPASLLANWEAEIARFLPALRVLVAHGSRVEVGALTVDDLAGHELVMTTWGMLSRLGVFGEVAWGLAVLDEAQAIKNPDARRSRAAHALRADARVAMTGTPIENRLGDLWSLFRFLCPGLLGTAGEFKRFIRRLSRGEAQGEGVDYSPLRALVRPWILRRLKSDRRVISDLPDKTEVWAWCSLTRVQAALYQQAVEALAEQLSAAEGMARRGLVLAYLTRFKQICNHPAQWLGDEDYDPARSGKFMRLAEVCEEIAARQDKALIFTQYRQLIAPLHDHLRAIFKRDGLTLHGGVPVARRGALVEAFQREDGPPFFVLSLRAAGVGLNLTAASHVIHFDRWWNPAVEDQATDRAYRIGQHRNVLVHKFVCRGTLEERVDALITRKAALSQQLLEGAGEAALTEMSDAELLRVVSLDLRRAAVEEL